MSRIQQPISVTLFIFLSMMCVSRSGAQEAIPSPLGLREAVRMALERNPNVRALENNQEIAEALRWTASRRLNPSLTATVEGARPFSTDQGAFFQTSEQYALLHYEIETGAKRRWRTQAAEQNVAVVGASLEDRKRLLVLEVQRAYFRAVLSQANLDTAEAMLKDIDQTIQLNRDRFGAGEISGVELRRIELERLRFLDDVYSSQLALRQAKSELLALLGSANLAADFALMEFTAENADSLYPSLNITTGISPASLEERALQQRPDLQAALREEQRAEAEISHQLAIRKPNFSITGGLKRSEGLNALAATVTVPLQLFNRNQGGIAQAEAVRDRARNLAAAARIGILLDLQNIYHAFVAHQERIRNIEREYLDHSEQARAIISAAYRAGEASLLDLLDAERAYRETRRIYHQVQFDYRLSLCELAAAVGERFPQ